MNIKLIDGNLKITATEDAETDLVKKLEKYVFKLTGFSLEIYNKEKQLLCVCDVVDNSIFIANSNEDALEIANLLGSKRFVLTGIKEGINGSILFGRDREFYSKVNENNVLTYTAIVGMDEIGRIFSKEKLYKELAILYKNYADFTDTKQQDYTSQELEDKFCRINSNQVTPIIMLDKEQNIVGCIRLLNVPFQDHTIVYLSDEVVKYTTSEDRKPMMNELFTIARSVLTQIPKLAFSYIRVASGRETMYEDLGCAKVNTNIPVIHGPATPLLDAIKKFIKDLAHYKLSLVISSSKEPFGFANQKQEELKEDEKSSNNFLTFS